jgi:hypothetical protein
VPGDEVQGNDERSMNHADAVSDLITLQINRAIQRWEDAFANKYFDENTYQSVLKELKIGKYCRFTTPFVVIPRSVCSSQTLSLVMEMINLETLKFQAAQLQKWMKLLLKKSRKKKFFLT